MKIDPTYLTHLKTLDQNATPGPWGRGVIERVIPRAYRRGDEAFIAESRTAVGLLVAEVERLQAENDRLLETIREQHDMMLVYEHGMYPK